MRKGKLKDRKNVWFHSHARYGVYPANWQGWIVAVLYIGAILYSFTQIDSLSHSVSDTLIQFIPLFLLYSLFFFIIVHLKLQTEIAKKSGYTKNKKKK